MIDTQKLRELQARATPGPLTLATSNSWRRIVSYLGSKPVCVPCTQPDGHPDLHFPNGGVEGPDATLLIEAWNNQPALLDEIDKLRGEALMLRKGVEIKDGVIKNCDAEIDRLRAELQARQWQPIETAPKDGSEILLSNGREVAQGWWMHKESFTIEHRDLDGRYLGQTEDDGYTGWFDHNGGMQPDPTHWMPLPPAPPQGEKDA